MSITNTENFSKMDMNDSEQDTVQYMTDEELIATYGKDFDPDLVQDLVKYMTHEELIATYCTNEDENDEFYETLDPELKFYDDRDKRCLNCYSKLASTQIYDGLRCCSEYCEYRYSQSLEKK